MPSRRPRPAVAALLSLLIVGLGDAYSGASRRGAGLLAAALGSNLVLAILWSALSAGGIERGLGMVLLLLVGVPLGLRIYGAIRAWRDAARGRDGAPQRRAVVTYAAAAFAGMLIVSFAIRGFVVQAFTLPSASMEPTLLVGDRILVNKLVPRLRDLRVGDVLVFPIPNDRAKTSLKRVIALGGESLYIQHKRVLVDGEPRDDRHARFVPRRKGAGDEYGPFTVPAGHVFVLGDNRDASHDSRSFGPVPVAEVTGRAAQVYWSWDPSRSRVRWKRVGHPIR